MTTLKLRVALEHVDDPATERNFNALQVVLDALGIYAGTGSPEGVVAAGIGSIYRRLDGGAGTSFYVKEGIPTPSTGWVGK